MAVSTKSQGSRVRLVHNDPEINQVIQMGFARLSIERSTDAGLTFKELTRPSERIVLEQDKVDYEFVDRLGDAAYQYRVRYLSEDGCTKGEASDPVDGGGILLLQILTVEELKQRYMFGVKITDDFGKSLPEVVFQHYILTAIAWMETQLDVPIIPTAFDDESHDYYAGDYGQWGIIQLENYPVLSVESVSTQYPSGSTVVTYPDEWLRIDKTHGLLRLVPSGGSISQMMIGQGGTMFSLLSNQHVPDLFKVSYTAGFDPVPRDILDIIGMFAALGPLDMFGDLLGGAGIASSSTSIDGLSQSINTTSSPENAGYGARVIQYLKQIKEQMPMLRRRYKGLRMSVM